MNESDKPNLGGRPSIFTPELGEQICMGLIDGKSLISICDSDAMPDKVTVYRWLLHASDADCPEEIKEFCNQYTRARVQQAEALFDECIDIADNGRNDWMLKRYGKEEVEVPNPEVLQRSKLRVETRITMAERLNPKKYRPQTAVDHTITEQPPVIYIKEPPQKVKDGE